MNYDVIVSEKSEGLDAERVQGSISEELVSTIKKAQNVIKENKFIHSIRISGLGLKIDNVFDDEDATEVCDQRFSGYHTLEVDSSGITVTEYGKHDSLMYFKFDVAI